MFSAYVIVTLLTVVANAGAAALDLTGAESARNNASRVGVLRWLVPLGVLKALGALGLLAGLVVPWIGVSAAVGLVLFFVGAVIAHVRVGWFSAIHYPSGMLLLAVASLVLRLATS